MPRGLHVSLSTSQSLTFSGPWHGYQPSSLNISETLDISSSNEPIHSHRAAAVAEDSLDPASLIQSHLAFSEKAPPKATLMNPCVEIHCSHCVFCRALPKLHNPGRCEKNWMGVIIKGRRVYSTSRNGCIQVTRTALSSRLSGIKGYYCKFI